MGFAAAPLSHCFSGEVGQWFGTPGLQLAWLSQPRLNHWVHCKKRNILPAVLTGIIYCFRLFCKVFLEISVFCMKGMKMASHHVRDVRDDKCQNFFLIPVFVKQQLTNKETVCETFWGNVLSEGGMRRYQPCVSWVLIWKKGMVSLMVTQAAGDRTTAAGRHTSVHTHYTPGSSTLSVCLPLCLSCLTSFLSLSTSPAVWLGILGILSIEYYHVVEFSHLLLVKKHADSFISLNSERSWLG